MKLSNSIKPLKDMLKATVFKTPNYVEVVKRIYFNGKNNPDIQDALVSLRYNIWYGLSNKQRHEVIGHCNLPYIGGYYEYADSHLDTLLNKVLTDEYLKSIVE